MKCLFVLKVLTVFYKISGNRNSKQFQLYTRVLLKVFTVCQAKSEKIILDNVSLC